MRFCAFVVPRGVIKKPRVLLGEKWVMNCLCMTSGRVAEQDFAVRRVISAKQILRENGALAFYSYRR